MGASTVTTERITGRHWSLHLSPEGVALTYDGRVSDDPDYQAASWEEVSHAEFVARQRRLMVFFSTTRPTWVIAGVRRPEALWAVAVISRAAARAALRRQPSFQERLAGEALRTAVAEVIKRYGDQPSALAELLMVQAVHNGATDIHFEPGLVQTAVRYRVDGQLLDVAEVPAELGSRLVSCLKVTGGMKVFQRHVAQTGRTSLTVGERAVDVRLTCLPTTQGEKITLRLFDPARALLDPAVLGMGKDVLEAYQELITQPQGCIFLTGPSGAGKTTTMYATLAHLHEELPDRIFATVEEPVELDLPGIAQTEVNRDVGLDFAQGLRTVLRQDPQVIMVGEIRDPETAGIAVQAGLTGHLVFSTVHAPSAAGVFTRLAQLGVEPYLIASSVTAVIAQRLVRKVCEACGVPCSPSDAELNAVGLTREEVAGGSFRRGEGCEACGNTGYQGRTGIFALLPVTHRLREAIVACRPLPELEAIAREDAVGDLWQSGLAKAAAGLTTLAELASVLGRRERR